MNIPFCMMDKREIHVDDGISRRILCTAVAFALTVILAIFSIHEFDESYIRASNYSNSTIMKELLPLCRPLDINAAKEKITCLKDCRPDISQTIEGLGLNPLEKYETKVVSHFDERGETREFRKYRYHFPEEDVWINQSIPGKLQLQPHAYHERLFRRIISKLYRAGVIDPSTNLLNSGSNMGDNALPWAQMLQDLTHDDPTKSTGKVYAIDPSSDLMIDMVNIANENSISNICTRMTFIGSKSDNKFAKIDDMGIENLGVLHLDLEGGEGEAILGALGLIFMQRPIIITEGHGGKLGEGNNDERVRLELNSLGYHSSLIVPEVCGFVQTCRNTIWWPNEETEAAAMAVIGKDIEKHTSSPLPMFVFSDSDL